MAETLELLAAILGVLDPKNLQLDKATNRTMQKTFLPAYGVTDEHRMWNASRIYDFKDGLFYVTFQAALCEGAKEHNIGIWFFDKWIPIDLVDEESPTNAFNLIKTGGTVGKGCDESYYTYEIESAEKERPIDSIKVKFTCGVSSFRVELKKNESRAVLSVEENTLDLNLTGIRYFVLIASLMERCPTFISLVDTDFDIWSRDRKIDVKSKLEHKKRKEKITVFYDIMVAFAVIIFYYLFLSELFLPVYFHFVMPLPVQKLAPKRTRSPKRLTFDVTMTAEDTTEKSSRDYSAATPPYRASVSGERSYKRATKSTTPSSRKGDPPMAKTQKSHTPSPSTPLGF